MIPTVPFQEGCRTPPVQMQDLSAGCLQPPHEVILIAVQVASDKAVAAASLYVGEWP